MSDQTSSFFRAQATSAGVEFTVAVVQGEVSGGVNEAYRETHSRALISRLQSVDESSAWPAPPHLLTLAEECGYAILVARDGASPPYLLLCIFFFNITFKTDLTSYFQPFPSSLSPLFHPLLPPKTITITIQLHSYSSLSHALTPHSTLRNYVSLTLLGHFVYLSVHQWELVVQLLQHLLMVYYLQ
jgi:hypothetical protein